MSEPNDQNCENDLIKQLTERAEKAEAFKKWVHDYLDSHCVPHHPPGVHGAAGCRIGDRMDWLMAKLTEAEYYARRYHESVECPNVTTSS